MKNIKNELDFVYSTNKKGHKRVQRNFKSVIHAK